MRKVSKFALWGALAVAILSLATFGGWIFTLPPAPAAEAAPPIPKAEADATIAAMKPTKRARQLIAIIGINDATEVTDYVMPYASFAVPT